MRINTNVNAMTALNSSTKTTALAGNAMEKLSSGLRINKAGDDAAGLAISEKMRSQIRGMEQANRNVQDGISMVQTAEGALEEAGNIVQRMRELAVQGGNETLTESDRNKINTELTQLSEEIGKIAEETKFNNQTLLKGADKTTGTDGDVAVTSVANATGSIGVNGASVSFEGKFEGITEATIAIDGETIKITIDGEEVSVDTAGTSKGDHRFEFANGDILTLTLGDEITNLDTQLNGEKITISSAVEGGGNTGEGGSAEVGKNKFVIQAGANGETREVNTIDLSSIANTIKNAVGVKTDSTVNPEDVPSTVANEGISASDSETYRELIKVLDTQLESINTGRSDLGAMQNRLEATSSNLTTSTENLTAAESRIRDVDVAAEMMNLSKLNLINQASQAMMMQAKSQPEGVMQLLR